MSSYRSQLGRTLAVVLIANCLLVAPVAACPFCNAVSQTLRQEMTGMDAVVIATATQSDIVRNKESGEVIMRVERVLKGDKLIEVGHEVTAIYYGDVAVGRRFLLSGVDPPELQWSCLPINERSEAYIINVTELADDPLERLRFFYDYLQDEETMLSRDAYDEFAITPYDAIKKLAPEIDHQQIVDWISDPEMSTDRKRLFLTMLGVCGTEKDLPLLEEMLRSTNKSSRSGLDALIACYLTLGGEEALPLIDELFLANKKSAYPDTYAAIMAIRFHGTEGDVIPRSALVEPLHHVLEREDLADLVIPDLARWSDWSQVEKLKELFIKSDPDSNWIRVPVINYLRACPLESAKAALEELKEIDPESIRRANTFFSIPQPAKDSKASQSSNAPKVDEQQPVEASQSALSSQPDSQVVMIPGGIGNVGQPTALAAHSRDMYAASTLANTSPMLVNPWRLLSVLLMSLATVMIAQFLLLSGGKAAYSNQ